MTQALKFASVMNVPTGEAAAGAIDLDGTNDYLSRASDLTGNADGKTFTFSAWVWVNDTGNWNYPYAAATAPNGSLRFWVAVNGANGTIQVYGRDSSNTIILACDTSTGANVRNTFVHVLVSVDLANTSNRYMYVNDVAVSPTWGTYTNANIDFTQPYHYIANDSYTPSCKGRLSHVFLDKTYRDLSNVTNRRYFITADRKPAASNSTLTSGIIYMPMDDPTTAHVNLGTGGNFTLNGTIARSGRGPNQFNVPYSDLDGAADYLSATSITGISDSSAFTFQASFNFDAGSGAYITFWGTNAAPDFYISVASGGFQIYATNSAGSAILNVEGGTLVAGRNYTLTVSIDMTSTSTRHVYLNGEPLTVTWSTYTSGSIDFDNGINKRIGVDNSLLNYFNGRLGNVFFHTSYIDLSVPANLAKFVTGTGIDAKPVDPGADGSTPLGVQPLIYLPMYGNNAGKNYGSGGDFTVNSGPFTGARGPNEFWGNKADFPTPRTGYLYKTSAFSGISNGKTFSASFVVAKGQSANTETLLAFYDSSSNEYFKMRFDSSNNLTFTASKSTGTVLLSVTTSGGLFTAGNFRFVQISVDLSNSANRSIYIDGAANSPSWNTYTNDIIGWTSANYNAIAGEYAGSYMATFYGKLSELFISTEYIDFSSEANRLKFRDAFGNPVDLTPQITAGSIPNPAIYMRFDPADHGNNSGTGGDFTKTGTINDGGQL